MACYDLDGKTKRAIALDDLVMFLTRLIFVKRFIVESFSFRLTSWVHRDDHR